MATQAPPDAERGALRARLLAALQPMGEVRIAYLHGSFLLPGIPFRDIDLAVHLGGASPEDALRTELRLSRNLTEAVRGPVPVDVRCLDHAPLGFRYGVIRQRGLVLERDADLWDLFECGTYALYLDFLPHVIEYRREALGVPG